VSLAAAGISVSAFFILSDFTMFLTIRYQDFEGVPRSFWVRQHEAVTVGSSVRADQQIVGDRELDRLHFQLQYEQDQWMLRSVSDRPLQLNEEYARLSVLQDGDRILAGRTTFFVALPATPNPQDSDEDQNDVADTVEIESIASPVVEWWRGLNRRESKLQGDALEYRLEGVDEHFVELLTFLHAFGPTALVWNRKAFGNPAARLSGWTVAAEDLFSQAPAEIRTQHSLSVGSIDWNSVDPTELASVLRSDSALLLFHASDVEQLIDRKKVMWGWFAQPSLLQFHLRNGSEMLVGSLVQDDDLILIASRDARELFFYGQSEKVGPTEILHELNGVTPIEPSARLR
jgi:hypothetical protein